MLGCSISIPDLYSCLLLVVCSFLISLLLQVLLPHTNLSFRIANLNLRFPDTYSTNVHAGMKAALTPYFFHSVTKIAGYVSVSLKSSIYSFQSIRTSPVIAFRSVVYYSELPPRPSSHPCFPSSRTMHR